VVIDTTLDPNDFLKRQKEFKTQFESCGLYLFFLNFGQQERFKILDTQLEKGTLVWISGCEEKGLIKKLY
jgi:hypothetical protein